MRRAVKACSDVKCTMSLTLTLPPSLHLWLLTLRALLLVCRLFRERLDQVKVKLDEVLTGKAGEYREPLATLQKNMQLRTQVAGNNKSETELFVTFGRVC